jgi:hypothetical protein
MANTFYKLEFIKREKFKQYFEFYLGLLAEFVSPLRKSVAHGIQYFWFISVRLPHLAHG